MAELKRGCGTISTVDTQNLNHQKALLDKNSLKLWLYTLLGSGYIKKSKLTSKWKLLFVDFKRRR